MPDRSTSEPADGQTRRLYPWFRIVPRRRWLLVLELVVLLAIPVGVWMVTIRMPGRSYTGPLQPLNDLQIRQAQSLQEDVEMLAGTIGERNIFVPEALKAAEAYLETRMSQWGRPVGRQTFDSHGLEVANLEVEFPGTRRANELVVIGAHYDSAPGTPGADDNASAVAGLLALGERLKGRNHQRTIRLVAFVNEELFQTRDMGSWQYACRSRRRGERIRAMLSLEMLGYWSDDPGSQQYPFPLNLVFPDTGNFIGFVADLHNRHLVRQCIKSFRRTRVLPSEGVAVPASVTGVAWSDHWSFWEEGFPALMVTDTAFFRNPNYHQPGDRPETLNYDRMARLITGLETVVLDLANRR